VTSGELHADANRASSLGRVVASAGAVLGDPLGWLENAANGRTPVAVECWVFDTDAQHAVLVEHRWRGWVPPGGAVEPDEDPREAARRELFEEAGIAVVLSPQPVPACLRSYRSDWEPTLSLTFAAVVDRCELRGESGQPCAWMPLARPWTSAFPEDRARMRTFLASAT